MQPLSKHKAMHIRLAHDVPASPSPHILALLQDDWRARPANYTHSMPDSGARTAKPQSTSSRDEEAEMREVFKIHDRILDLRVISGPIMVVLEALVRSWSLVIFLREGTVKA